MGEAELKRALRRDGEERVRRLWQQAEEAVSRRRQEIEDEVDRMRHESERALQAEIESLRTDLMFEAGISAMACRLHAEAALEKRLFSLAQELVTELPGEAKDELWQALCRELPATDWETLTVHPADQSRAKRDFPSVTLECDESICGGVIAATACGDILIDNSLRCRLQRAWPKLLPKLLHTLRAKVNHDEPACQNTTV